jgi:hypothetical protein
MFACRFPPPWSLISQPVARGFLRRRETSGIKNKRAFWALQFCSIRSEEDTLGSVSRKGNSHEIVLEFFEQRVRSFRSVFAANLPYSRLSLKLISAHIIL